MEVKIRVDSSVNIGSGHVMRCLTLAKQLRREGASVTFIIRGINGHLINLIQSENFIVEILPGERINNEIDWYQSNWKIDAQETLSKISNQTDLLIVDHYGLDEKWETVVKDKTRKLMVIDDLADRRHNCDILLDQNYLNDLHDRYKGLVPDHCLQLLGPNYVLLREEFIDSLGVHINRNAEIQNILVFFGGTDPSNQTLKTLKALSKLSFKVERIEVIVGSSNLHKEHVMSFCKNQPNMHFNEQVKNMADYMRRADLAIGAGGTTTWERCLLGLPTLTVVIAENQAQITNVVEKFGATINLGWCEGISESDLIRAINSLYDSPQVLIELAKKARELIDPEVVKSYPVTRVVLEEINGC